MLQIKQLIETESINMHFQPIISVDQKKIMGFEALCRGTGEFAGVPPDYMFTMADKKGLLVELDRLCRRKAFAAFSQSPHRDSYLFINFNAAIIDKGVVGSMVLYDMVMKNNLHPHNIVIEIVESKVKDIASLKKFIAFYRELGFIIALDDIGCAYSNLERISILKPDILKIDRSILTDIHQEYHKREILKSLVNLGKAIGAMIIGEGLEKEEEALTTLHIGVDMLQGYYIQKPMLLEQMSMEKVNESKDYLAHRYKTATLERTRRAQLQRQKHRETIETISRNFINRDFSRFSLIAEDILRTTPDMECVYFLDQHGIQASPTFFPKSRKIILKSTIFRPGDIGTDHSMKDYFYQLQNSQTPFFRTCPYLSKATGNLCITLSAEVIDNQQRRFILCLDMKDNP